LGVYRSVDGIAGKPRFIKVAGNHGCELDIWFVSDRNGVVRFSDSLMQTK
jgi:hypothetical protein